MVARSNEAKSLGIQMGTPAFQIQELINRHEVIVFSSNYTLYADLSNRVMTLLAGFVEEQEVYSIDEAFLSFAGFNNYNLYDYGTKIVRAVTKGTGIPVSLGIADTKTLAKVASKFAKKYPAYNGVCIIDTEEKREKALRLFPVEDVWGIGRKHTARLKSIGVKTAYDFTQLPLSWIKRHMSVTGERTYKELLGESCIDIETNPPSKKQICTSRSFGEMISDRDILAEAVSSFADSCARKLRAQKTYAVCLMVFIHTNYFRKDLPQYSRNMIIRLPVPTSDTREIIHHALIALDTIFCPGFQYKKAGVIILEITNKEGIQMNLFEQPVSDKSSKLMQAIDRINGKHGKKIRLAVQGSPDHSQWHLKQEMLSPQYTTNIKDILRIKCD